MASLQLCKTCTQQRHHSTSCVVTQRVAHGSAPAIAHTDLSSPSPASQSPVWASRILADRGFSLCARAVSNPAASAGAKRLFHHPGEHSFNLAEYMVVLDKPIGLTLALDPDLGKIVVQSIQPQSPADVSQLISVGDVVNMCSAVFGDEMWPATDIRRVKWAILNRTGKVKLMMERRQCAPPQWYLRGQPGMVSYSQGAVQLPVSFHTVSEEGPPEVQSSATGAGRMMHAIFHRCPTLAQMAAARTSAAVSSVASGNRSLRVMRTLRAELAAARTSPGRSSTQMHAVASRQHEVSDAVPPHQGGSTQPYGWPVGHPDASNDWERSLARVHPAMNNGASSSSSSSSSGSGSSGGSSGGAGGMHSQFVDKQVVTFLPWLLVSKGRLDARGIAHLAGQHGLGALLELNLVRSSVTHGSVLAVKGTEAALLGPDPNVFTFPDVPSTSQGHKGATLPGASINGSSIRVLPPTQGLTSSLAPSGALDGDAVLMMGSGSVVSANIPSTTGSASSSAGWNGSASSTMGSNLNGAGGVSPGALSASPGSSSGNGSGDGLALSPVQPGAGVGVRRTGNEAQSPVTSAPGDGPSSPASATQASGTSTSSASSPSATSSSSSAAAATSQGTWQGAGAAAGQAAASPESSSVSRSTSPTQPLGQSASSASTALSISISLAVPPKAWLPGSSAASASPASPSAPSQPQGSASSASALPAVTANGAASLIPSPAGSSSTAQSNALRTNGAASTATGSSGSGNAVTADSVASPAASSGSASSSASTSASLSPPSPSSAPSLSASTSASPARLKMLLHAVSSLQRLAYRRGGALHHARPDACAALLQCEVGMEGEVATMLAGWLHWHGRLPLQEACLAAEVAMDASVDTELLDAATAHLLQTAQARAGRVVLTWKYGGLTAQVAGTVVGSWLTRVSMQRCKSPCGCKGSTARGQFYLAVAAIPPGTYHYKYIVDGTWTVDPASPKVLDSAGNWNNVLDVAPPAPVLTSREGLALARWQAAHNALANKLGLPEC